MHLRLPALVGQERTRTEMFHFCFVNTAALVWIQNNTQPRCLSRLGGVSEGQWKLVVNQIETRPLFAPSKDIAEKEDIAFAEP